MKISHTTPSGTFEWDSNKNTRNIQKHGIDFFDAIEVFSDEQAVLRYDITHSGDEERFLIVGRMRGVVVTAIVFTDRCDITRLISARKATREEELDYERNIRNRLGTIEEHEQRRKLGKRRQ